MGHARSQTLPVLGLIAAMMLWGSSFIAIKVAYRHYDPMVVTFGRMAMGSMLFLCFRRRFLTVPFRRQDIKSLVLLVLFEPCACFLLEAQALVYTTASQAGMFTAMLPLMAAVAAYFFLGEQIRGRAMAGFALAIAGACWLSWDAIPSQSAPNPVLGNFLEFSAMVCATGYIVVLKRLTQRYSPFFLTAMQAFAGCLFFFPTLFLPSTTLPVRADPVSTLAVVYLGSFITLGAYGLYNYGMSRIPASRASAFVNLIPVFSVLLGWLLLGETLTPGQCAAAVLIFSGVILSAETGKSKLETRMVSRQA